MSVEKSPDSMNERHYALCMLPLTLSVPGRVNAAGLGWQVIQLTMALTLFMFSGNAMANNREHQQIALVGTWTHIPDAPAVQKPAYPSEGLYHLAVNGDGTLTLLNVIKMKSPSWIVTSRDGRFAYATNEEDAGTVTALAIDKGGSVRVLNTVSSAGQQPTHATLSPDGKFLFVANYSVAKGGAGVTALPIGCDGKLGERVQHYPFTPGSGAVHGRQDGAMHTPLPSAAMANTCTRRISAATSCMPTAIARITRSRCRRMLRAMSPLRPAPAQGTWCSRRKGNTPMSSLKWRVKSRRLPSAIID